MKRNYIQIILICFLFSTSSCNSSSDEPVVQDEVAQDDPKDETSTTTETIVSVHGQLSVNGSQMVNKDGEVIQLRGMSLSWTNWWPQFYTKEVVGWLKKDWNVTVIRASMGIEDAGGYLDDQAKHKALIFNVIDAAIEEGIYVLVDWHSHHAEEHLEEAKAFFTEVSEKYGDQPNIIYETYNEPLDTVSWNDVIKPYHEAVITEIRKNDPDNIIIAGTRSWSQRVDEVIANELVDDNVMYTLHYYAASHKQELRDIAQAAITAGIPLFVTEHGVTEYTGDGFIDVEEANTWWNFLDQNKISWLNWSIADKEESSAAVKPGASGTGGWPDSMLTQSGLMVREELREKNPVF